MAKKNNNFDDDFDDEALLGKKAKRKLAKSKEQQQQRTQAAISPHDDTMSRIALLCQEQHWREAYLICVEALRAAQADGNEDVAFGLQMASQKLESSLRRQMAAAFISASKQLLKKEYLLDVGH